MANHGPQSGAHCLLFLALVVITACGGAQRPVPTAAVTKSHLERGEAAERARAYDQARAHYQLAVDTAPDASSKSLAAQKFGRALVFWGELEGGARMLELSAATGDTDAGTWHDLGMVRFHLRDAGRAEAAFRRSIALASDDPRPRVALAAMLWKIGKFEPALAEYRALSTLDLPPKLASAVAWAIQQLVGRAKAPPSAGSPVRPTQP